jgi:acetyl-CoA carboxylase biotin carboxyl carrier protein
MEIEKDGMRIRLKKSGAGIEAVSEPVIFDKKIASQAAPQEFKEALQKSPEKTVQIKAPMVGTFYRAPSPEAPPYVETEQVIETGQVICIIEAMKLMNEIKSEIKGKVLEILVDNSEPVEFGQPMFIVEPL